MPKDMLRPRPEEVTTCRKCGEACGAVIKIYDSAFPFEHLIFRKIQAAVGNLRHVQTVCSRSSRTPKPDRKELPCGQKIIQLENRLNRR